MRCKYTTSVRALCPVDKKPDVYTVEFTHDLTVFVEHIIACVKTYESEEITQEDLTQNLSRDVGCNVKSVGWHSGVKTEVWV